MGLEALNVLIEEGLIENAADQGAYLLKALRGIDTPLIREIRGRGLLIGMEIDPDRATGLSVCEALAAHGILTYATRETVIRFAPPLIITRAQIDWARSRIEAALSSLAARGRRARQSVPDHAA